MQYYHSGAVRGQSSRVVYYDVDTNNCQSGSPVTIEEDKVVQVGGIHKGYDGGKGQNVATRVTPSMVEKIVEWSK